MKRKIKQINLQDDYGYSALHYAARNNHFEIVKFLAQNGADLTLVTNGAATALHRAGISANENILDFLLGQEKINMNAQDDEGQNFLHKLARSKNLELFVKFSMKFQTLNSLQDSYGKTPSDYF